jgi:hypothetical protein
VDEWGALRTVAAVVAWITVMGGLVMATIWFGSGGARAVGPEDELLAESGVRPRGSRRRQTSFSTAQVGIHGLLGTLTASLVTYAMVRDDDRGAGYVAVLVAILVTAVPGTLMFRKWRSGQRPHVPGVGAATLAEDRRVEDHLPRAVVYAHGLAAAATATLVVVLLAVD